jgi:zinc protease
MSRQRSRARAALTFAVVFCACGTPPPPPALPAPSPASAPATRPATKVVEKDYWADRRDLLLLPPVQPAPALALPALRRFALKNGLRIIALPDRQLPLVDVRLVVRGGAIDDPADKVGLAEFVANMLRQGTRRQAADVISEAVDSAGAGLRATAGYEQTTISCSGRSRSLDLCLQLVSDLARQASFPEKEMGEVRDQLIGDVKQSRDDPATLAELHFNNLLYGDDHPGGRPMTVESLQRIARGDLVAHYQRLFVPRGAILAVSGDVDVSKLLARLERAFGAWRGGEVVTPQIKPVQDPPPGLRVLLVDKPDLTQSFFALGHAGIKRTAPDRDAVVVMNYILGGGGFASRLMRTLRSRGKTYGIRSAFDEGTYDGSFIVQSFTNNDGLVSMLQLVQKLLAALPIARPTDDEIRAAKGHIAGGYALRLQTPDRISARLMLAELWGLPESFVTEYPLRIERQSAIDVFRAARQRVRADRLVAAVVGRAEIVAPRLRAAKIPFEQVSYLAPISAAERKQRRSEKPAAVTADEQRRASETLGRVLEAAGGAKALGGVRSLRLTGQGTVENMSGAYSSLIVLPDHLRQSFDTKPVGIVQVLAGKQAFIQVGPAKRALPADVAERMRGLIWRDPILLPLHATGDKVRCRPSADRSLAKDATRVAVEVFPPAPLPPTTLVIDRRTWRVVEIRYVDRGGQLRVSELGGHKKVSGVLVPHKMVEVVGKRRQTVTLSRVEINPPIAKREILGGTP